MKPTNAEISTKDAKSIYDVVRPIHALSKYLGITPFQFLPGNSDPGPIAIHIFLAATKSLASAYLLIYLAEFTHFNDIFYAGSDLMNFGHILSITVSVIQSIVCNVLNIVFRHTYLRIYIEIYEHDQMLPSLGKEVSQDKAMRRIKRLALFLYGYLILHFGSMFVYFLSRGRLSLDAIVVGGVMILNITSFALSVSHFYFLLSSVGLRLRILNNCIG